MTYIDSLISKDTCRDERRREKVIEYFKRHKTSYQQKRGFSNFLQREGAGFYSGEYTRVEMACLSFETGLLPICSNIYEATNYIVEYVYFGEHESSKQFLWLVLGRYIYETINNNKKGKIKFPIACDDGDIDYLYKKYKMEDIEIGY